MGLRQPQLGNRRGPVLRRVGVGGFPGYGGMMLDNDPGAIPPNRFRHAENVRFRSGTPSARPGLVAINTNVLNSASTCITGIFDFQPVKFHKLILISSGCSFGSATTGYSILFFDEDQARPISYVVYFPAGVEPPAPVFFDGDLYIAIDDQLKKAQPVTTPWGTEPIELAGNIMDIPIATFPGFKIRCFAVQFGKLFIGLDGGAGASKIAVWDGLSITYENTGIDPPIVLDVFRDLVVAGFAAATNSIHYRTAASTSWTAVAPGAGTISSFKMASYKDNLYITSDDTNIWKWTGPGGTLASDHALPANSKSRGLTVFDRDNKLYFAYGSTLGAQIRIGSYDGVTYTDLVKDLFAQLPLQSIIAGHIAGFRGSLFSVGNVSGTKGYLLSSPGTDIAGTWVVYNDFVNGLQFVHYLYVL